MYHAVKWVCHVILEGTVVMTINASHKLNGTDSGYELGHLTINALAVFV